MTPQEFIAIVYADYPCALKIAIAVTTQMLGRAKCHPLMQPSLYL